jgi:hypothetical protein
MAQVLKALKYDPDATPPTWHFQLIEDGVPGGIYRTMKSGEEANPTLITLPDPEFPEVDHDLIQIGTVPS